MDKHNNQQKNKNKNAKKPQSPQASAPVLQDPTVDKDDATMLQGKKSNTSSVSSAFKKK